ncbi:taste receptor type 1 member 1 [Cololabis saira]|uniref:taste receptor type 1 member 1 n=1 Tax=Cololabis saira TaxID=129043 RepID=UPI002AD3D67F|nr:taste receptor type 1 member 1 [Cololabis saira]
MKLVIFSVCLLGTFLPALTQCTSEFHLNGDYILGGLFDIHYANDVNYHDRPVAIDCSRQPFSPSNYRRFQMMRFSVEEINNSSSLLPNVSLGYEIIDYCSDIRNFPAIFKLLSVNGLIRPWSEPDQYLSKLIAMVGPFTSTQALTVAPFFMSDLIPMVNYGSSSSVFSNKVKFPSFLRTVHPSSDLIEVMVAIVQHFNWKWVAFIISDDDYGKDGLELFVKKIRDTEICLAYTKSLSTNTNYSEMFQTIELQKIRVLIVFASQVAAVDLVKSAIQLNITNMVWVAGDTWSLNNHLQNMEGIENIGTVLGVTQPISLIPGFGDYIRSSKSQQECENDGQQSFCNQVCNCSHWTSQDIINADPSFSFSVYSAVYAIAHALHKTLQCGESGCHNITVYPDKVLAELEKSNFTLLNMTIRFDEKGDLQLEEYPLVFWNHSGEAQMFGFYRFHPTVELSINRTKIRWHKDGEVPSALCSPECLEGYARRQNSVHRCCFTCKICPSGTYVNVTEDPFSCKSCLETEWSAEGSTSCILRLVEYIPFTHTSSILVMIVTCVLVGVTAATSVLFVINYNTPVVRSAGGPMCLLILVCFGLSSLSVFFYFGKPTPASCVLRYFPFLLFYTVCLACFVVRSFQIVCIFKISAKFPKLLDWWRKYNGQWVVITAAFIIQAVLLITSFSIDPPRPYNETAWYQDQIVLFCSLNVKATCCSILLLLLLGLLCFIFSYMGKDLPKNYNEAKSITFCLLLLILTWIIFVTVYTLYHGKYIQMLNALAVLSSLSCFLLWYFLPKCYIIAFQPQKNTQQHFQGLIQDYTKTISQ